MLSFSILDLMQLTSMKNHKKLARDVENKVSTSFCNPIIKILHIFCFSYKLLELITKALFAWDEI